MADTQIVFTNNLKEVLEALEGAKEKGLAKIGAAAQGYAKDLTPVRTGVLRDSIGVEVKPNEDSAYIGTLIEKFPKEPYGKYVELGSVNNKAHHMLQRAASEHTDEYKRLMEESMKNA